jgi:hypothetical protein
MHISSHGGSCCGINHIQGFGYNKPNEYVVQEFKRLTKNAVNPTGRSRILCMLVEVVLVGSQLRHWKDILEETGYKEVSTFKNRNSRNVCHVFHCSL